MPNLVSSNIYGKYTHLTWHEINHFLVLFQKKKKLSYIKMSVETRPANSKNLILITHQIRVMRKHGGHSKSDE